MAASIGRGISTLGRLGHSKLQSRIAIRCQNVCALRYSSSDTNEEFRVTYLDGEHSGMVVKKRHSQLSKD